MKTLIILNDPPYGTERSYNALRLAGHLAKREGEQVRIFLIGDAAACAKRNQKVPPGYYNVETMLGAIVRDSAQIGVCGTCMDARGIADQDIYNVETMLGAIVRDSAQIGVCGTCMDARGIADQDIAAGAHRSAMKELTDWTLWADRVVTF